LTDISNTKFLQHAFQHHPHKANGHLEDLDVDVGIKQFEFMRYFVVSLRPSTIRPYTVSC